jgi:hypothetical protein
LVDANPIWRLRAEKKGQQGFSESGAPNRLEKETMSKARARVIVHIGQHKTGTKALQSFLARNVNALKRRGVFYPIEDATGPKIRAYAISHYRVFALLRREAMEACGDSESAKRFWAEQRALCRPYDSLRDMLAAGELRESRRRSEILLLSAEDLFDMHSAHETDFSMAIVESGARILAQLLNEFEYDPMVAVYLRRQDHLLAAHYAQYIKGSQVNHLDFASFARAFAPRLETRDILAHWASAFGAAQIRVQSYEHSTLPLDIVPDFFERVLGFAVPADWVMPARDPESVNVTPGRDMIEFIRILNRRNIQGLSVFRREDVLKAALAEATGQEQGAGVSAWLSPKAQRTLLDRFKEGNQEIEDRFRQGTKAPLFTEPFPEDNGDRDEYTGLSADRAIAIALKIQEMTARKD